ncbi:hypothetical protein K466DRAFT_665573 [Polyporus arcularius HHB13444]|uniref:Uncharacterized protein n=1 Tax=Polyporus arcularius HHB13444 TaxID=1314778 RepID=A0A5C3P3H1_9APHY|nr:hypothetical protein K466DRAFT_665573 [Polyporus arcularius HHB13444]
MFSPFSFASYLTSSQSRPNVDVEMADAHPQTAGMADVGIARNLELCNTMFSFLRSLPVQVNPQQRRKFEAAVDTLAMFVEEVKGSQHLFKPCSRVTREDLETNVGLEFGKCVIKQGSRLNTLMNADGPELPSAYIETLVGRTRWIADHCIPKNEPSARFMVYEVFVASIQTIETQSTKPFRRVRLFPEYPVGRRAIFVKHPDSSKDLSLTLTGITDYGLVEYPSSPVTDTDRVFQAYLAKDDHDISVFHKAINNRLTMGNILLVEAKKEDFGFQNAIPEAAAQALAALVDTSATEVTFMVSNGRGYLPGRVYVRADGKYRCETLASPPSLSIISPEDSKDEKLEAVKQAYIIVQLLVLLLDHEMSWEDIFHAQE